MHISFSNILQFATLSLLTSVCASPISNSQKSLGLLPNPFESKTDTITAINQKLSLYGFALDYKELDLLKDVYAEDVVANLGRGPIHGREKLLEYYTNSQGKIPAHHFSSNVYVSDITSTTATVKSDALVTLFGEGPKYPGSDIVVLKHDQLEVFYERFEDKFVKERDGEWRIKTRELTILAIVGDTNIES
ncbi:hypothetical protein MMC29_002580 [Sticta canariensis]|nr:hypothetical protein [Sticta canariensis]